MTISNTVCRKMVYGGNVTNSASGGSLSELGNITLDIDGGTFQSQVVGGSRLVASENISSNVTLSGGTVTLDIDGGTFADSIFGAGYALGNKNGQGNENEAELSVDEVVMTLSDLTVNSNGKASHGIYAGGLAARGAKIYVGSAQTRDAGAAVNITVASGSYTSIYGGGWAESKAEVTVNGGVAIAVSGGSIANLYGGGNNDTSGAKTYIAGDVLITVSGGTINNIHAGAKYGTSRVNGDSTVQIAGDATIGNIYGWTQTGADSVRDDQILDVDASLSCNSISHFDIIDIAAAVDVTGNVDLVGDAIVNIDLASFSAEADAEWTVLSAAELNNLKAVTFGTAEFSRVENVWSCGEYTLTFNDNNEGDDTLVLKYTIANA